MGLFSKQYVCINTPFNLSYTPPSWNKFQTNSLVDTNQIYLIGEYFDIHGYCRH